MKVRLATLIVSSVAVGTANAQIYLTLSNREWGLVNPATAVFTPLGHSSNQMGDVGIDPNTGQAWGIRLDSALVKIDKANGVDTFVAASTYTNNMGFSAAGQALMIHNNLVEVNQATGALTNLNPFTSAIIYDLATTVDGRVFATDSTGIYMRTLAGLGPATYLGATVAYGVFGMAFEDEVLYCYGFQNGAPVQFEINQLTGAGSNFKSVTGDGFNSSAYAFGAVGQVGAVPEPATLAVIGAGAVALLRRR